jgi:TolB-like protein/Tfp pilus assembly protein PilF
MNSATSAFGPFVLDRERKRLTRNGQPVPVGHRGYILLETLIDAGGEPVSKQVLMERAWPGTTIEEGNLTVQISTLRRQLGEGADAIIVTVPRVGYRLVAQGERREVDRAGPPLIAVLPFANHGSTAEDGYFADGVVDDIITALSRFKTFAVVSRGSSFALRDKRADARAAASELGVRYALEGSIRRMGERLRVTAQLLDATSGAHLWAERYEGAVADIFSFQDRMTESVVGVIEPTIRKAEIERARRKPAANLDAYDLFLRALPLVAAPGPERHEEALALLHRAAALDPGFALPPAYAAWVYEKRISLRQPPLGNSDHETCVELARIALKLGGDDPLVRAICGFVLYRVASDLSALEGLRQAVTENPNNVVILNLAGAGNRRNGAVDESYRCYARAYELSPGAPEAYQCLCGMGATEMIRGNYEAAIDWCHKSLATFNDWVFTYATLATSYVNLDRMDEAAAMVRRITQLRPDLTVKAIEDGADPKDPFAMAVIPGLRKAGLPER